MSLLNALKGKRKFVIIIAVIVAVMVPFTVFAATSNTSAARSIRGIFGIDPASFNDRQKADATEYINKMAQLQKEFIDKMVANGALTKEQGDEAKARIDERLEKGGLDGLIGGFGGVSGKPCLRQDTGYGPSGKAFGLFGIGKADLTNLTDKQKAALEEIKARMHEIIKTESTEFEKQLDALQKELVNKLVEYNVITKEQGDAAIKAIDENSGCFGPVRPGIRQGMKSGIWQSARPCMPSGKGSLNKPACGDCDGSCVTE